MVFPVMTFVRSQATTRTHRQECPPIPAWPDDPAPTAPAQSRARVA